MSKKTVPLESVIRKNEDKYWEGKPEKMAFIFNDFKDYAFELFLRGFFDVILLPFLIIKYANFNVIITIVLGVLWCFHAFGFVKLLGRPINRAKEWKDIYYIITDKHFYIQFGGGNDIYYRMYPIDRIGTKVFYRKNPIDSLFSVGTIGISVDDYYEERVISVKDFENVYRIFKGFTDVRKIEERQKAEERAMLEAEEERLQKEKEQEQKQQETNIEKVQKEEKEEALDLNKEYAKNEDLDFYGGSLDDQINNTPKFETYEEYRKRSRDILEESRREELRREAAKRRAAEARYRSQMRQQEAERAKQEEYDLADIEEKEDNDMISSSALSEVMDMQDEFYNSAQSNKGLRGKQKRKPQTKKKNKQINYNIDTAPKPVITENESAKYDGDDPVEINEISKEKATNLDLSVLWSTKKKN